MIPSCIVIALHLRASLPSAPADSIFLEFNFLVNDHVDGTSLATNSNTSLCTKEIVSHIDLQNSSWESYQDALKIFCQLLARKSMLHIKVLLFPLITVVENENLRNCCS